MCRAGFQAHKITKLAQYAVPEGTHTHTQRERERKRERERDMLFPYCGLT